MLYTKYESSGLWSFRQEDFWKLHFENLFFLTPWPTYATNQNHLNNFGRRPHRDHSCKVWSKSNEWRCLSKNVYARRTTDDGRRTTDDDGQRPVTIAHPEHFVLRWAKNVPGGVESFLDFKLVLGTDNSTTTLSESDLNNKQLYGTMTKLNFSFVEATHLLRVLTNDRRVEKDASYAGMACCSQ